MANPICPQLDVATMSDSPQAKALNIFAYSILKNGNTDISAEDCLTRRNMLS